MKVIVKRPITVVILRLLFCNVDKDKTAANSFAISFFSRSELLMKIFLKYEIPNAILGQRGDWSIRARLWNQGLISSLRAAVHMYAKVRAR